MKKMIRNSLVRFAYLPAMLALLAVPSPLLAKQGVHIVGDDILVEEEPDDSGVPDSTDGPLLDKMSDSGMLYGDLYRIARYKGFEINADGEKVPQLKNVPVVGTDGKPVLEEVVWLDAEGNKVLDINGNEILVSRQKWATAPAVGGEPILTEDYADYTIIDEEKTIDEENPIYVPNPLTGDIYYPAPLPSQCVQPVADAEYWGVIPGLVENRLPLLKTYDATWQRTECEVDPGVFLAANATFEGVFDTDVYHAEILWADLVQEVEFGRLNLARAPQAVLDASFDEAISSLNAATDIKIDASGRLMVTTEIYDEFLTDENGDPLWVKTEVKAIDSPKENLALYVKLMKDGHLITPADERVPIDYSVYGGMPINQLLELEDGPSDTPRPTIDIVKMQSFGLGHLVDAGAPATYSIRMESDGSLYLDVNGNMDITCTVEELVDYQYCVEYEGIITSSDTDEPAGDDFPVAASFFAAAADKKGNITVDKIVYINSILGINKVVGYSEDGTINYAKNPVYFDYEEIPVYDRATTFVQHRGQARVRGENETCPDGSEDCYYIYDGTFEFLEESSDPGTWVQTYRDLHERVFDEQDIPEPKLTSNIGGFTSMADDDLQVIIFTHTYQIPGLR